jgi:hypothetical protein
MSTFGSTFFSLVESSPNRVLMSLTTLIQQVVSQLSVVQFLL